MWPVLWVVLVDLGLLIWLIRILRKDWRAIKKALANPETPKKTYIVAATITWFVPIVLFAGVGFAFTVALLD